ncbi:MAG: hypothetical protein LBD94_03545 [Rickettsiales bacterium]|jgi:hypothetical protein|nr:hypothetical protein [Rickettsiales bacterium]
MSFGKIRFVAVFVALALASFARSFAAKCKVSDLQACLDSACYDSLDGGSRCYMCGTSAAKKPAKEKYALGDAPQMQTLSVGKSSKNTISDKDLKKAPEDPGERYQWATSECIKKLKDCTTDDATENYDKLIDASCKIALGESDYAATMKKASEKKTSDQCSGELSVCLLDVSKCGVNMLNCEEDSEFNRNFSICMSDASGCGDFATVLRDKMRKTRDDMVAKKESRLSDLVALRQMERKEKFESANRLCTDGGKDGCILEMCGNFPMGLDENGLCSDPEEKIWAASLCKFVDIACNKLK